MTLAELVLQKAEKISEKKNNCTLVAIQEVSGASDADIFAAFRRHNYKDNDGMYASDYMAAANELGVQFGTMKAVHHLFTDASGNINQWTRNSLGKVAAKLGKGVFLVRTKRHVLVVRDGKIVDKNYHRPCLKRTAYDFVEVLNPYTPVKQGYLKSARRAGAGCRFGSKNYNLLKAAHEYLATHTNVTQDELLRNCRQHGFHLGKLKWEMKRGNIVEV